MINKKGKQRGFIGLLFVFLFLTILLVFAFGILTPMLISIDSSFMLAGQDMLEDINVSEINDPTMRAEINDTLQASIGSIPDQIQVIGFFHQYAWVIVIVIVAVVMFMIARTRVEANAGGGFV